VRDECRSRGASGARRRDRLPLVAHGRPLRKPGLYAQVGIACYLRVELDPPHVVAYLLGPDGVYEEVGRAEPGEVLKLTEPFPISIDPTALVR